MAKQNNNYREILKKRREVIKDLPEEMKVNNATDVVNYEHVIAKFKFKSVSEEDTDIMSYKPAHDRFDVQFSGFEYVPRFVESGMFKYIKRFLNKLFPGTYFMDIKIVEINNAWPTYYNSRVPMTNNNLHVLWNDINSFINIKHQEYLHEMRNKKIESKHSKKTKDGK